MKNLLIVVGVIIILLVGLYAVKPHFFRNLRQKMQNRGGGYSQDQQTSPGYNQGSSYQTMPSSTTANQAPEPKSGSSGITLSVTSPKENEELTSLTVTVAGKTAPNADIAVNEKDIKADSSGNFSTTITLESGDDEINVVANDNKGNFAEQSISVVTP